MKIKQTVALHNLDEKIESEYTEAIVKRMYMEQIAFMIKPSAEELALARISPEVVVDMFSFLKNNCQF